MQRDLLGNRWFNCTTGLEDDREGNRKDIAAILSASHSHSKSLRNSYKFNDSLCNTTNNQANSITRVASFAVSGPTIVIPNAGDIFDTSGNANSLVTAPALLTRSGTQSEFFHPNGGYLVYDIHWATVPCTCHLLGGIWSSSQCIHNHSG